MENKYYIPKLNEFHIGFRYETSTEANLINNGKDNIWYTEELTDTYQFADLFAYSNHRVKYLCETDIKELGWELVYRGVDYYFGKHINQFAITKNEVNYKLSIDFEDVNSNILIQLLPSGEILFCGSCKNYNELSRLMAQTMVHDETK